LNSEPQHDSPLSTALLCGPLRDGSDTGVASADDIHTPVENSKHTQKARKSDDPAAEKPPGEFVSDELAAQTKRFLEEVKGLAKRRRAAAAVEQKGPPPPEEPRPQRSRRR
jgi:hypothetical protein